ncbi:MAG: hypothetical protein ABI743_15260, partial [bacterium]
TVQSKTGGETGKPLSATLRKEDRDAGIVVTLTLDTDPSGQGAMVNYVAGALEGNAATSPIAGQISSGNDSGTDNGMNPGIGQVH